MSAHRFAAPHSANTHHFDGTMPLDPARSRSISLDATVDGRQSTEDGKTAPQRGAQNK
jgi:hypothetical protein